MSDAKFTLERQINAPIERVWKALTDPALVGQWYGPMGSTAVELDVRVGGVWLSEMSAGEHKMRERMEYTEVEEGRLLVWEHSAAGEDWATIDNPMMPNWPRILIGRIELSEMDGGTKLSFSWEPKAPSAEEAAMFKGAKEGFGKGFAMSFDKLKSIVAG